MLECNMVQYNANKDICIVRSGQLSSRIWGIGSRRVSRDSKVK